MPKRVDHQERRRRIAEALWRIAAERGLEAVSFREVAAEAGVSIGSVQHYFAGKEDLLLFATSLLRERLEARIRIGLDAQPDSPGAAVRTILEALLPTTEDGRTETLVGIAFFNRALNDPTMAERYRRGRSLLAQAVADQLRAAGCTDDLAADSLLALVDGLASELLLGRLTPDVARRILDRQLAQLPP